MKIFVVLVPEQEASDNTSFGYEIFHFEAKAAFTTEIAALEFRDRQDAISRIYELDLQDAHS